MAEKRRMELTVQLEIDPEVDEERVAELAEALLSSIGGGGEALNSIRVRTVPHAGTETMSAGYTSRLWEKATC